MRDRVPAEKERHTHRECPENLPQDQARAEKAKSFRPLKREKTNIQAQLLKVKRKKEKTLHPLFPTEKGRKNDHSTRVLTALVHRKTFHSPYFQKPGNTTSWSEASSHATSPPCIGIKGGGRRRLLPPKGKTSGKKL